MKLGVGVMLMFAHTGKRETSIDCAPWKSYWEEERKGGYDCHKIALLLSLIFFLPSKVVALVSVLVFGKKGVKGLCGLGWLYILPRASFKAEVHITA